MYKEGTEANAVRGVLPKGEVMVTHVSFFFWWLNVKFEVFKCVIQIIRHLLIYMHTFSEFRSFQIFINDKIHKMEMQYTIAHAMKLNLNQ